MSNKTTYLPIRVTNTLRQQLEKTGEKLGFTKSNGDVNFSRVIRYLVIIGLEEEEKLSAKELAAFL